MKPFKRGGGLLSGLVLGLMVSIGSAQSNVVYDWTGTCTTNCTGTATAVLTLDDTYTPGTAVDTAAFTSQFVSFSFSSSSLSYNIPGDNTFFAMAGTLPNGVSSLVLFTADFAGTDTQFRTLLVGGWNSDEGTGPFVIGSEYRWSLRVAPVPLPASAWMFMSSLLAFGLYGWWRRRKIAVTA